MQNKSAARRRHFLLSAHNALFRNIDGALVHMVDPCQALAAAIDNARGYIVSQGATDTGALSQ